MTRLSNTPSSRTKITAQGWTLLAVALAALLLSALILGVGPAAAGPAHQDSPLPTDQVSPLPVPTEPAESPTPATLPTATVVAPAPETAPGTGGEAATPAAPPIPIEMLIGIMVVIGLIALAIGLRRR